MRVYISSLYIGQQIKLDNNHLRDHPYTEITNILFILFISKFIAGNITQDHCDVILKIPFALFIYLDTIRGNGSIYKKYIGYAVLRTCRQSSRNRKQQAKYVIQLF